jgi:hypothetical protein
VTLFGDLPGIFVDTFGEDAVILVTPVNGVERQVAGIFRAVGLVIAADDVEAMGEAPMLHIAEDDCADLGEGAAVAVTPSDAVEALAYTVATRQPDGRGMVVFRLQEAG